MAVPRSAAKNAELLVVPREVAVLR